MHVRWRQLLLLSVSATALAIACGETAAIPSLLELPDPTVQLTEAGTGADADTDTDAGDAAPACPPRSPDDALGTYVAPGGTDTPTCGTRDEPCSSIAAGLDRASGGGRVKVYLARGLYVEKVVLKPGITLEGGWDRAGNAWSRACVAPEDVVVIRAPLGEATTIVARDLGGAPAGLSLLHVESKPHDAVHAGESLYGIVATGATTTLVLTEVRVDVGAAGAGKDGAPGDAGVAGDATGCATTADGGTGDAGVRGEGAEGGTLGPSGYVASNGGAGAPGTIGQQGTAGGAGSCVQGGTCAGPPPGCTFVPAAAQTCGAAGLAGCAGGPGAEGRGGMGGGSAIGVFVWDANVQMSGGHVRVGDGGNGGAGGEGGKGGSGAAGVIGGSAAATAGCADGLGACIEVQSNAGGGAAGGAGGSGGNGGPGGGGAGGWSVAIYQGGAGVVTTANTELSHGNAGKGGGPDGGAGSPGVFADRIP